MIIDRMLPTLYQVLNICIWKDDNTSLYSSKIVSSVKWRGFFHNCFAGVDFTSVHLAGRVSTTGACSRQDREVFF